MSMGRRYCLITPCRDEAEYARRTLDSIVAQTVTPTRWVIVDDGSTDATPALLAEYAARHPWIQVVTRKDRGKRAVGPGVIDAFYAGWDTIKPEDYDYVCKLDLDLELRPRYFERLMELMEADPRLGTVSGKPWFYEGGQLVSEKCGDEMSVGMTKFYRTRCFQQIGGFVRQVMWDGIDCHRARMLGWKAASVEEPDLRFIHLRPMGSSQKGIHTGRMRHGFGQHFMGTSLAYLTASSIYRITHPPVVTGAAATWWGFVKSRLKGEPRYDDLEFRRFLRRYQRDCLLKGKARATRDTEERMARNFDPSR